MTTEIYICAPGQKLEDGKMVVSDTVTTKADAQVDAERRCKSDSGIARIVYYAVQPSGDFKSFFSYKNPKVAASGKTPNAKDFTFKAKGPTRKKRSLLDTLKSAFK